MHARSVMADMRHPQLKLAVQGQDNILTIAMMNDDSNTYKDSLQVGRGAAPESIIIFNIWRRRS